MAALRKLKARKGFSLAETLVAVLILAMLSSAAALGVSQALWQRNKSIALADAQTVASTAAQMVTDQLRYGRIASVEDGGAEIVLFSGVNKDAVHISLDEDGYLKVRQKDGNWEYRPLEEDAYCGLHLSQLKFELHESGGQVKSVDVSLSVESESDSLWDLEFSVSPMDPKRYTVS